MVEKVRDVFKEGFEASKFVIATTVEKQKDGMFVCKGRIVQSRGRKKSDGDYLWDDRTVISDALGDNHIEVNNAVLNALWTYMIKSNFYLFNEEGNGKSQDNIQKI